MIPVFPLWSWTFPHLSKNMFRRRFPTALVAMIRLGYVDIKQGLFSLDSFSQNIPALWLQVLMPGVYFHPKLLPWKEVGKRKKPFTIQSRHSSTGSVSVTRIKRWHGTIEWRRPVSSLTLSKTRKLPQFLLLSALFKKKNGTIAR